MTKESEWKELKIDDLPGDFLVRDYVIRWKSCGGTGFTIKGVGMERFGEVLDEHRNTNEALEYHPRQKQKTPTHEEIMTKWWKTGAPDHTWLKVVSYTAAYEPYVFYRFARKVVVDKHTAIIPEEAAATWANRVKKEWFMNRESATIPPEVEE